MRATRAVLQFAACAPARLRDLVEDINPSISVGDGSPRSSVVGFAPTPIAGDPTNGVLTPEY